MVYENWPSKTIDRLASRSLSAALRHAQDRMEGDMGFEAATPAGSITLPGMFSGWRGAITLGTLFGSPPEPFRRESPSGPYQNLLYRIYQENKQTPLYIGMAPRSSIQCRVADHFKGMMTQAGTPLVPQLVTALCKPPKKMPSTNITRSEIAKLRALTAKPGLNAMIKVQYGEVVPNKGVKLDAKLLHAFETALQVKERPHSYVGSAWTFEDDWF